MPGSDDIDEFWVTFRISDSDAIALDEAVESEHDERVGGVIREEPNDGSAMVVFQVHAPAGAKEYDPTPYNEALEAYGTLRENAGLPADDAPGMATITHLRTVSAGESQVLRAPRATRRAASLEHEKLLLKARTLYAQGQSESGQYAYAVLVANAACELAIAHATRRLIAAQASHLQVALERLIGNRYSLSDARVSGLWDALADDDIRHAPFWGAYETHLTRRHSVVHDGQSVSRQEAELSVEVAQDVCDHVTRLAP